MPHGPVLSSTLALINEEPDENSVWNTYITAPSNYCVSLKTDCPSDQLSRAEEELAGRIFERYGRMNRYRLRDMLHEVLPEWRDPNGSSLPIEYRDILAASGKTPSEIAMIESEL